MSIEAMKQALEAMDTVMFDGGWYQAKEDLRQAIAEAEKKEPVALETVYETIIEWDEGGGKRSRRELARRIVSLYTSPPQRQWVGLTDEQIVGIAQITCIGISPQEDAVNFAKAIEAKLKEKNT